MTAPHPGPATAQSFYPDDDLLFRELVAAEDRHFWFIARNQVIAAALRRATRSLPAGFQTLEIGCGTGNVLRLLEKIGGAENVVGMDMFAGGLRYARQRTQCALVQGDLHAPPFQTQFHLIGMFDVIEHLADESRALLDARALLAPGGKLLLTVPANMSLWSYADEFAGHQRRYDQNQLREKLLAAGFRVDYVSYFMATTYPIMWLKRRATSWTHRTHSPAQARDLFLAELRPVPIVNGILRWLAEREATLIASGRVLPFGTSLLAVATRPEA
ncbi:MAG: class I SAM-dependent methyltransferase [Terriglobales bacterium]